MSSATVHAHVAAWVGGTPVPIAEVDAQLDRLRAGPHAGLLPVADSAEGRQLRRWATQVVVTRHLLELEAAARGLAPAHDVEAIVPDRAAALELGGIVANVLAHSPPAQTVFAEVTRSVHATAEDVASYYSRNGDEFADCDRPATTARDRRRRHRTQPHLVAAPTLLRRLARPTPCRAGAPRTRS